MLEVVDFLGTLRRDIGRGQRMVVLPVAMSPQALTSHVYQQQCDIWQRKLATVGDPWLRVQAVATLVAHPSSRRRGTMSAPVFVVVGHPNKGKSSIVATLAQDDRVEIAPDPGTTTHSRYFPMRVDGRVLYTLVDTPGFQRPRDVLRWLQQHETSVVDHPTLVQRFVEQHAGTSQYDAECRLLQPIIAGGGILYVVDGSVPFGSEYEPEMEILRWTGRSSMALINPIGQERYIEQWEAALGQYFKIVRVFNAMTAEFEKRLELLRAFGQLHEDWRQPMEVAVSGLGE